MVCNALKKIIQSGNFEREDILHKLDVFVLAGRITQNEYQEFRQMMGE